MASRPEIRYLNTDLDLVSPVDLVPLTGHLTAAGVSPLMPTLGDDGLWYVAFETDESFDEPETNIAEMLGAIEAATGAARSCRDSCTKREFDVGYESGQEPRHLRQGLSNALLRRVGNVGASLRVTLYAVTDS
jgi:hypothetical protein